MASLSEQVLQQISAEIRQVIPCAEVRLFGSHARGEARPDSVIDTFALLREPSGGAAPWLSHVIARAYLEGRVLYDQP
ncbi:MAG: nucleotidyltransferase domain-containing protein [Cyanobacteriota bacterium]